MNGSRSGSSGAPRIAVFDYGAGNLHSLVKSLDAAGAEVRVESDARASVSGDVDALVLPGVGAFQQAAQRLGTGRAAMRDAIAGGLPTLGICLGMQLLFDESEEGQGAGIGAIPGTVARVHAQRVPHIGWNEVEPVRGADGATSEPLFAQAPLPLAYYANSFVCRPADERVVTAWSTHERDRFAASVRLGNAVGVQFHPEKSSAAGVALVHAWVASLLGPRVPDERINEESR